jgi:chromosome segregation ATPase
MRLVDATSPPRSPEREQLAEAIARHADAARQIARIRAAQERAADTVYEAKDRIAMAISALDEAKATEGSFLAAIALGESAASASPVKDCAAAVEQANDQLDTARRTRDALETEMKAVESEMLFASMAVDKCVGDVVRDAPAIRALAGQYAAAQRRAVDLQRAMETVQSFLPDDLQFWHGSIPAAELISVVAWKAALQTLRTDADAPLPS